MENNFETIVYKKSWLKSALMFFTTAIGSILILIGLFEDHSGTEKFFLTVILLSISYFVVKSCQSLFRPFYLILDEKGLNFSGSQVPWSEIHEIRLVIHHTGNPTDSDLSIAYGEKNRKIPVLYLINLKKECFYFKIQSFQLRADLLEVKQTIERYRDKFGNPPPKSQTPPTL